MWFKIIVKANEASCWLSFQKWLSDLPGWLLSLPWSQSCCHDCWLQDKSTQLRFTPVPKPRARHCHLSYTAAERLRPVGLCWTAESRSADPASFLLPNMCGYICLVEVKIYMDTELKELSSTQLSIFKNSAGHLQGIGMELWTRMW